MRRERIAKDEWLVIGSPILLPVCKCHLGLECLGTLTFTSLNMWFHPRSLSIIQSVG